MALARPLAYEIEIELHGTSARAKRVDTKVRQTSQREVRHTKGNPRPKSRPSAVQVALIAVVWLAAVGLSLLLVHRWAVVAQTGFEITRIREELVRLETEHQALQAEAARLQSLVSIEERALALGMHKPANIKQVASDPTAVAAKLPVSEPAAAIATADGSLWQSVRQMAGGLWQQSWQFVARLRIDLNRASAAGQ